MRGLLVKLMVVVLCLLWIYVELIYGFFFSYMFVGLLAFLLGASLLVIVKYVVNADVSQELTIILTISLAATAVSWIGALYFPDLFTRAKLLNFAICAVAGYLCQDFIVGLLILAFGGSSGGK
jgi:hypothetical protein